PPGITTTNLGFPAGSRAITSINLNPNDNDDALITLGNYGNSNYIYRASNLLGGSPTFTNITGNLPSMPVYDGFIELGNSNLLFVGTDLGVYASDNGGTTWTAQTNEANGFPKVPVLALRQYIFPGRSRGAIYAGTHGRGFFECQQYFTSIKDIRTKSKAEQIKAYPNPADNQCRIEFNLPSTQKVSVKLYDLSGKMLLNNEYSELNAGS